MHTRVAIVGSGFSGLGKLSRLRVRRRLAPLLPAVRTQSRLDGPLFGAAGDPLRPEFEREATALGRAFGGNSVEAGAFSAADRVLPP